MEPLGESARAATSPYLRSIQACRGVAAVLVVLFHASSEMFTNPKFWNVKPVGNTFDFGSAGVYFFFVLSGFIILQAHWSDLWRPERAGLFLRKRFIRVYPIYWLVLMGALLAVLAGAGNAQYRELSNIAQSVLLLQWQSDAALVLSVAWTLIHEMIFYALFYIGLRFGKPGWVLFGLWISAGVINLTSTSQSALFSLYFSHLHLLFALGMMSAWVLRRHVITTPGWLAALGVAAFLLLGLDENLRGDAQDKWRALGYGCASVALICGLVTLERAGRLYVPRWSVALGSASYSLYLVHFPVMSFAAILLFKWQVPGWAAWAMFIAAGLLAGLCTDRFLEKPLLARLKRYTH